ncbi:hypothetical protein [Ferrimicrobium sp.]|uniref:hypothetical protein n=1 Tax=Ferrimicrobium sp. TaxID=2926050 RepID=UPI00262680F6|nr:hypothetical protein [Ferrimicrobium sp.]
MRTSPMVADRSRTHEHPRQVLLRLLALTIVVLAVLVVLTRVFGPLVDGSRASSEVFVVRRGDTLVSIAERADPNRNPYPIVAQMEVQTHGTFLVPGERIVVPIAAP